MAELWQLTATEMVARLKARDVLPTEALETAFARIEQVEPQVHALPTLCRERALAAAKRLEAGVDEDRRDDPTWLAGLPIAVKDLTEVAGVRTTFGSPIFADHVPERSDILVERLEANGAIVIGKSNTPEFGAGGNTFNAVFPSTVTPWNTSRSAAGSSGGSAAALATGEVWLATGSDYGGSLRSPASFCGIVGLRPSPGRVANGPTPFPYDTMGVQGPMARTVGDVALMLGAMAGSHPLDPLSIPAPDGGFLPDRVSRPCRVAYSPDLGAAPVIAPEVADICARAVEKLQSAGWEVTEDIPDFSRAMEAFYAIRGASFAASKSDLMERNRDQLKPDVIWNTEAGLNQPGRTLAEAERERGRLVQAMVAFFSSHDLLLSPTACLPPYSMELTAPTELNGYKFKDYMEWLTLPSVLSLTGCPVMSLPAGLTSDGLPVGLQLCGPNRAEKDLLSAAAQAEQILGMVEQVPLDPRP